MDPKDREIEELKKELALVRAREENAKPYMCMKANCANRALCS